MSRREPRAGAAAGAPPLPLFLLEGHRALFEGMTLLPARRLLDRAPRGDGHPVLVLPGFTADDGSTRILRQTLRRLGHRVHGWRQGRNLGLRGDLRDRLVDRVDDLVQQAGQPLSIVGWSLGGVYAREIAKGMPAHVRQVVTLGSPFADTGRASNVSRLFDRFARREGRPPRSTFGDSLRIPPDQPSTAIYSRTDGVVHWSSCQEPETDHTENIEVPGSHCGLGVNPLVLYAVADRLSQPAGGWRPFARDGWRRLAYA